MASLSALQSVPTSCIIALLCAGAAESQSLPGLVARIAQAETRRDSQITEVRSLRRYTLHNERWKSDPKVEATMVTDAAGKKHYEIVKMEAEGLQKTVLTRILDGEVQAAEKGTDESAIVPSLYDMQPLEESKTIHGRSCQMMRLMPKKRTKFALDGEACVDTKELAVLKVEGRTAKNVSFWVGRPYLIQEFKKVGGSWFSSYNRTIADVRFFGKTELTVEFLDYSIKQSPPPMMLACTDHPCAPSQ